MSAAETRQIAFDTSVVVPALLTWHEHHDPSRTLLQVALAVGNELIMPLPTLVESYAVLTRLPQPWRIRPRDAHALLSGTFRDRARVVGLDGDEGWHLIDRLDDLGLAGGASYDAHILRCAEKAGATQLATFNVRDFGRFDLGNLMLLVP